MKRLLDAVGLLLLLPVVLPIGLLVAVVIVFTLGRPIFFRQQRIGLNESPFLLWKFRTMLPEQGPDGGIRAPLQRINRVGWWIRRFSLDEVPQLMNVALGEMSIVGPRPLLRDHLGFMTVRERSRHSVLPGITGWSQVHAYGSAEPSKRLALDVWYAEHISFMTDVRVLLKTLSVVVFRPTAVHDTGFMTLDRREE
ncbi:sugar transferase [Bryobacter aggregatus]|uniref:sugar transferase n=1 Tax=Bryobacter aggregatus TaxID=360054 RepID=UPI0004E1800E|nr:sugar transferase [Bryobacter aggregatus]